MAAEGPTREERTAFRRQCLVSSCHSFNLLYIPVAHLRKVSAFRIVGTGRCSHPLLLGADVVVCGNIASSTSSYVNYIVHCTFQPYCKREILCVYLFCVCGRIPPLSIVISHFCCGNSSFKSDCDSYEVLICFSLRFFSLYPIKIVHKQNYRKLH